VTPGSPDHGVGSAGIIGRPPRVRHRRVLSDERDARVTAGASSDVADGRLAGQAEALAGSTAS